MKWHLSLVDLYEKISDTNLKEYMTNYEKDFVQDSLGGWNYTFRQKFNAKGIEKMKELLKEESSLDLTSEVSSSIRL